MSPELPPQEILQTSILQTYVGGEMVYELEEREERERGEGCMNRRGRGVRERKDYRQPHH